MPYRRKSEYSRHERRLRGTRYPEENLDDTGRSPRRVHFESDEQFTPRSSHYDHVDHGDHAISHSESVEELRYRHNFQPSYQDLVSPQTHTAQSNNRIGYVCAEQPLTWHQMSTSYAVSDTLGTPATATPSKINTDASTVREFGNAFGSAVVKSIGHGDAGAAWMSSKGTKVYWKPENCCFVCRAMIGTEKHYSRVSHSSSVSRFGSSLLTQGTSY